MFLLYAVVQIAHHMQWHAPALHNMHKNLCALLTTCAQENQAATRVTCGAKVDPRVR